MVLSLFLGNLEKLRRDSRCVVLEMYRLKKRSSQIYEIDDTSVDGRIDMDACVQDRAG